MTTWLRRAGFAAGVLSLSLATTFVSADASAQARRRVANVDVDGDGLADVVVAENPWDGRGDRILVHRGAQGGPRLTQTITSLGAGTLSVQGLYAIGDVNGDRRTDVLVVDPRGAARVLLGTARGLSDRPAVALVRPDGEIHGVTFAAAGDVDGDGFDDIAALVACTPAVLEVYPPIVIDCRDPSRRHLHVWHGSAAGPAAAPSSTISDPTSPDGTDGPLVPVGDLDGDGFADVGRHRAGAFVVHRGSAAGLSRQPAARLLDRRRRPMHVQSAASAGDVDGDGIDDLAVTVYDDVRSIAFLVHGDRGRVFGRVERLVLPRGAVLDGWIAAGDLDGSGRGDIALSTFIDDARRAVLVWRDGRASAAPLVVRHPAPGLGSYGIVACPGDTDGDGVGDLVSGSPISGTPLGGDMIGRVYVHRGSAAGPSALPTTTLEGGRGAHGDLGLFIAGPGSR
ncbi:MAG: VCBS repeat-containing protein [Deltaproteobacteria bacterium]|nr:VCBS repeat-containing protein [Deltaproteobacteria bacterium]